MTDLARLVVKLEAQTSQFNAEFAKVNKSMDRFAKQQSQALDRTEKRWRGFNRNVTAAIGILASGALFRKIITETSVVESAMAQLEAVVKSTGGAAGFTAPEMAKMALSLSQVSTFGDDAIMGMQSVLATFTQISGPQFEKAQQAILDMSTRLGTDLKASAVQVGKALNDPVRGMAALRKAGVQLDDAQQRSIRTFIAQGDVISAQGVLLDELSVQFGGAAQGKRNTFEGAIFGVGEALDGLFEAKTGLPAATEELNKLSAILSDPAMKAAADNLFSGMIVKGSQLTTLIAETIAGLTIMGGMSGGNALVDVGVQIDAIQKKIDRAQGWGGLWGLTGGDTVNKLIAKRNELIAEEIRLRDALGVKVEEGEEKAKGGTFMGDPAALASIDEMIVKLEEQIAVYGKSADAVMRYRIEQGDLQDMFIGAGPAADELKEKLIALAGRYEHLQKSSQDTAKEIQAAKDQIESMEADLVQQIAVLGLSEEATIAYRIAHGDLADTFKLAGESSEQYKQRIIDLTKNLRLAQEEQERLKEAQAADEEMDKRAEEVKVAIGAPLDERDNAPLKEYRDTIAELNELIARGKINQEEYNQAVEMAQDAFDKANKTGEAFLEQASKNVQDILGQYLEDPFGSSIEDMIADFGRMLVRMAAQAVAADIAGKIFGDGVGSGGGWVGTAMSAIGGFFGGGRDSGGRGQAGKAYLIGAGAQPEMFVPDSAGTFIPNVDRDPGQSKLARLANKTFNGDVTNLANKTFNGDVTNLASTVISRIFGGDMNGISVPSQRQGPQRADALRMLGAQRQPEMFVPDSAGTFIPNVDREQGRMKLAKTVSRLFGGKMDQGGMGQAGRAYMIGASAQPEAFVPDRPVRTTSTEGSQSQVNHFNFSVAAPGGRVSRETEQQIAAAAARGIAQANRRNN